MDSHLQHPGTTGDEELLRCASAGCQDCFALLFHRYCRRVLGIAYRMLRDRAEAEDIAQEVFLAICKRAAEFDPNLASVRTWILQFAYHKALLRRRYLRTHALAGGDDPDAVSGPGLSPRPRLGLNTGELAHLLDRSLASLTPAQRETIELVNGEGLTLAEAAQQMRVSLANTRNNYYRGLQGLRARISAPALMPRAPEPEEHELLRPRLV